MPLPRREFFLSVSGLVLGPVMLPDFSGQAAASAAPVAMLMDVPRRYVREDGSWSLFWCERCDGKLATRTWEPKTPQEIADATAFLELARRRENTPGYEPPPRTIGERLAHEVKSLFRRDYRRRSPHERELIAAVLAEPDSFAPLAKYADWLTAQGDPQGEFIRLHAATDRDSVKRRNELGAQYGERFVEPLRQFHLQATACNQLSPWSSLRRGVVAKVKVDRPGVLPQQTADLFFAAPFLEELELEFENIPFDEIAAEPQFGQIRKLRVNDELPRLTPARLRGLAESPFTGRLTSLDLGFNKLGPEGARALAAGSMLSRLNELDLGHCELQDAGVVAVLEADRFEKLTDLNLDESNLTPAAYQALAECRSLSGLQSLSLTGNSAAVSAWGLLGQAAFTPSLRQLKFGCFLDPPPPGGIAEFAAAPLERLESFSLEFARLDRSKAETLLSAVWLGHLKAVNFGYCRFPAEAWEAFSRIPFRRLEELNLHGVELDDALAQRLFQSPACARLKKLDLSTCGLSDAAVTALAACDFSQLEVLSLAGNAFGERGARALLAAEAPCLKYVVLDDAVGGAKAEFRQRLSG